MHKLVELNNSFYKRNAASFSSSRQSPWPGWSRVARCATSCIARVEGGAATQKPRVQGATEKAPRAHEPCAQRVVEDTTATQKPHMRGISVVDVACGNMRFERFLVEQPGFEGASFTCVDSFDGWEGAAQNARFDRIDVLGRLMDGETLGIPGPFDLAVSFGFMHHIPSASLRERFACELAGLVKPGGVMVLSFWRFMDNEALAAKARATTALALAYDLRDLELEDNDFLLGWNDVPGAYRYCHSFTQEEEDAIARSLGGRACLIDSFTSDGRTQNLNSYLVFQIE